MLLGLALAAFVAAPAATMAAPKGAELLQAKPKVSAPQTAAAEKNCPACKDVRANVAELSFKAATHGQAKAVAAHQCASCTTKFRVEGHGKASARVATHSCTANARGACCAAK